MPPQNSWVLRHRGCSEPCLPTTATKRKQRPQRWTPVLVPKPSGGLVGDTRSKTKGPGRGKQGLRGLEDDAGRGAGLRGPCHTLARSRRSYPGPKNEIQGSLNSMGKTQELHLVFLQNALLPLRQVEAAKASSVALGAAGPGASARLAMEGVLKPQRTDDCVAHSTSTCC